MPNSMAMVFIPIVIYLLFRLRQQNPGASFALSALFMATVILTHNMAAVMLGGVLFCVWLGFEVHRMFRYQAAAGARILLVATILFTGATLSYWTVPGYTGTLRYLAQIGFRGGDYFDRLPPGHVTPPPEEVTPPPADTTPLAMAVAHYHEHIVPFGERLFNQLGFLLFFGFAAIGALAMLSRSTRHRSGFAFVFAGLMILAVAFFGIITHRIFLEERWNHLSQVLLAVPVGVGLLWIAGLPGRKAIGGALIALMIFALAFLMIVAPPANVDNRTLSPNTVFRGGFAESEFQAFGAAATIYDGALGIDPYGVRPLRLTLAPDNETSSIVVQLVSGNYSDCGDMLVLIRSEVATQPFPLRGTSFRLDHDPRQALTEQGFSKVYFGGEVAAFAGPS